MINKNVKKLFNEKNLGKISFLNLNLRPEEIRPEIYYKLTEIFEKRK